jgi:uncharacterized damage-inducible protein DinB
MKASTPPVGDEREGLMVFLAQQRGWMKAAAFGLDEGQARATPTGSALSVGGLVKHLADVELGWSGRVAGRPEREAGMSAYMDSFHLGPDETLAGALDRYQEAAAAADEIFASVDDLGREIPVPAGFFWVPAEVKSWSVRWVLLHLVEETARHAGHADIIRETLDGAQSTPLLAAMEGWPESEWLKPWRPAERPAAHGGSGR